MKKTSLMLALLLVFSFALTACEKKGGELKLNKSALSLYVGDEETLTVSGAKGTVEWASSAATVASVSTDGKVKAVKAGTATITATANKKSDGKPAVTVEYQGVPLIKICEKLQLDISDVENCSAFAADGYVSVISVTKVCDPENVFIVTGQNGEALVKKDDGGDGPFMLVVVKDPFNQSWCKYLSELTFE